MGVGAGYLCMLVMLFWWQTRAELQAMVDVVDAPNAILYNDLLVPLHHLGGGVPVDFSYSRTDSTLFIISNTTKPHLFRILSGPVAFPLLKHFNTATTSSLHITNLCPPTSLIHFLPISSQCFAITSNTSLPTL